MSAVCCLHQHVLLLVHDSRIGALSERMCPRTTHARVRAVVLPPCVWVRVSFPRVVAVYVRCAGTGLMCPTPCALWCAPWASRTRWRGWPSCPPCATGYWPCATSLSSTTPTRTLPPQRCPVSGGVPLPARVSALPRGARVCVACSLRYAPTNTPPPPVPWPPVLGCGSVWRAMSCRLLTGASS